MKIKMIDFKKEILKNLEKHIKNPYLEIPTNKEFGDYSFPCFELAKEKHQKPNEIAKNIVSKLKPTKNIKDIRAIGPYINFYINDHILAKEIIKEITKKRDKYGSLKYSKERIMVEFSQSNTHKAFHIGHVRGTSLGESISRIMEFCGDKVIRVNYQGDTGMHVAKWIWCYLKYYKNEKLKKDEGWIASIYIDAVKKLSEKPELQEEVENINKKLEEKSDKKLNELWKKTRKLSLDVLKPIYNELNTKFDKYYFESQVEKKGKEISKNLVKKGIANLSEGAIIINLKNYNMGVWVLLRKDGTVLYSAKDIALALKKFNDFDIDKSIYVVAHEQQFHFKQLFKVLELMKIKDKDKLYHLDYNLVKLPTGRMSSRTGENVIYSEFKKELVDYIKSKMDIKSKEAEKRVLTIAIASLKYSLLKQSINKEIVFEKEKSMKFEGDTGPYLLYTYARAKNILRKAKYKPTLKNNIKNIDKKEKELLLQLYFFPEIVRDSRQNFSPNLIANYSYKIAKLFNEYYHENKVIGSENQEFRLKLVDSFSQTLKNSMRLLGIDTLEKM